MADRAEPSGPRILLYGPDPTAAYRTGGVARWMEYLGRVVKAAGLPHEVLYLDPGPGWRRILPKRAGIAVGMLQATLGVRLAMRRGCTLLHVNTSLYPRIAWRDAPVVAAARQAGLPVLLQVHGGRLKSLETAPRASRWLWTRMFEASSAIGVFPGPQLAEFRATSLADRVRPLRNVVPESAARSPEPSPAARFLFLGSLTEAKGALGLVRAFAALSARGGTDSTLIIAGAGPLERRLREAVVAADLTDSVRLVGHVTNDRLQRTLDEADVFVLPSRAEGFPLSFLEAAERGMACLITRNSAVAELFVHDREVIVIPPHDDEALVEALHRVAADASVRASLGQAVQARVRAEYTIEAAAPEFRRMYTELVAGSERTARE